MVKVAIAVSLALFVGLLCPPHGRAQTEPETYAVKFVCGERRSAAGDRPAPVAPGRYFTAVNLYNTGSAPTKIQTSFATTAETPVAGAIVPGPTLAVPPNQALELDCDDILRAVPKAAFSKGFVVFRSSGPLEIVAVYTAANSAGVASIDVERYASGRGQQASCPDLTFGRVSRPVPDQAGNRTTVSFVVVNQGTEAATNIEVRVEDQDPSVQNQPERIATGTISMLGPGQSATVTLVLPYFISGNQRLAALLLSIDPKNQIAECREDNNQRTVGAP